MASSQFLRNRQAFIICFHSINIIAFSTLENNFGRVILHVEFKYEQSSSKNSQNNRWHKALAQQSSLLHNTSLTIVEIQLQWLIAFPFH